MGIYIKGLTKEDWNNLTIEEIEENFEIVEVKTPHGRLIDAEKWHKRLQKQAMTLYESDHRTYGLIMDIMGVIHTEPTVIESEVK